MVNELEKSNNKPLSIKGSGISIKRDQHVFIAGKTGSGKTTLAMYLLFSAKRLIIVDSKDTLSDWNVENDSSVARIKLKDGKDIRIRVVERETAIELLELAYSTGDVTIYIDEMAALIPPRSKPPQVIYDLLQRGRSRNVSVWTSTQRPTLVPLESISEATHFFVFRLNLEDDRKRIASIAGKKILNPVPDKHGFYYLNDETDTFRYWRRLVI